MLVWLDVETTGLEADALVLEIGAIVTDDQLNEIDSMSLVVGWTDTLLGAHMSEWARVQHGSTGLINECRRSGLSIDDADRRFAGFLLRHSPAGKVPLCGSSVHFDRRVLARWMPATHDWFNYRNVDVSSVREMADRWHPTLPHRIAAILARESSVKHRVMGDLAYSISLAQLFKNELFS